MKQKSTNIRSSLKAVKIAFPKPKALHRGRWVFNILLLLIGSVSQSLQSQNTQTQNSDTVTYRQPLGRFPDDALVTRGSFDRSISLPGTNGGAFRIGGIVLVNTTYDFDNLGFQQISTQPTIPLDGSEQDGDNQFGVHIRFSRVNFDYRMPTSLGEFRTFVEIGLFGQGGSELVNDYTIHVRHAVAEIGNWKFGQFWSGFMDPFAQPETADVGGPLALPSKRNPGIFYVNENNPRNSFGFGMENPTVDLSGNSNLQESESMPSFVGFIKIQRNWGYTRLSAMTVQQKSTTDEVITGGLHLSGRINLPFIRKQDNFSFGVQYGEGFVHYYSSFIADLDGIIRDDGEIEATGILGAFGAYQHWWSDKMRSTFNASFFDFDLPSGFNPTAYSGGYRLSGNIVATPIRDFTLGLELNYDTIETFDGSEGEGLRLELVTRFDF